MILDVCFFFFLIAFFHLFYQMKVFLNLLLVFELLTLLIFSVGMYLGGLSSVVVCFHSCLVILSFGLAEAVMGLAILISCSRYIGKAKVKSFSLLKF
uniref:NADH dehydrogenase subunit 4L n=1 Tax=Cyclina sinensis TaxID=120566 RepID=A0A125S9U5_CYCSN|nr:NADH dehydrogenase subunit 4L [Cyclina sinensis]